MAQMAAVRPRDFGTSPRSFVLRLHQAYACVEGALGWRRVRREVANSNIVAWPMIPGSFSQCEMSFLARFCRANRQPPRPLSEAKLPRLVSDWRGSFLRAFASSRDHHCQADPPTS